MSKRNHSRTGTLLLAVLMATSSVAVAQQAPKPATPAHGAIAAGAVPDAGKYRVLVHRSPSCGCCMKWVAHMREAGFQVDVRENERMDEFKDTAGVPEGKRSCHTAQVGDYFIEGHVPAPDILRLLADAPRARGLTVPGMPVGSPGMEVPDGSVEPYAVELVHEDGTTSEFARHGK